MPPSTQTNRDTAATLIIVGAAIGWAFAGFMVIGSVFASAIVFGSGFPDWPETPSWFRHMNAFVMSVVILWAVAAVVAPFFALHARRRMLAGDAQAGTLAAIAGAIMIFTNGFIAGGLVLAGGIVAITSQGPAAAAKPAGRP
jgi:hypothetical protein